MFPETITIKIGTRDVILTRINQDNYGSEYRFRGPVDQVGLKIRHSLDNPDKPDGIKMERHNVFFEHVVYPTPTTAIQKFTTTFTIRNGSQNDPSQGASLAKAVNVWLASGAVIADLSVGKN